MAAEEGHRIAVLDRAASLLFGLAQSTQPTTLNEAARLSGLSKATAFRILSTLTEEGFVVQDAATSSYRLGVMPLRLATSVLDSFPFQTVARQAMRAVCDELNETTVLSVIDGDSRVSIDAVECSNAIGSSRRIGEPRPLHVGAAGRTLLSALPDEEVAAYMERAIKAGTMSRAAKTRVWEEVRRTRRTGFASSAAEISPAVHAVATGIKGPDGSTLASLHVSIPSGRLTPRIEDKCRRLLARAARDIARGISAS
jgi:IclR family acetate operon transcriptional repressor